jgi:meiotically up-regulated gene 157 (Mug157) protein
LFIPLPDTTVQNGCINNTCQGIPKTFVITGDIPAMWIRDSTSQMNSYLPLASQEPSLKKLILGVIYMQAQFLNIDTYANAFKLPASSTSGLKVVGRDTGDKVPVQVWEEKYEIDSLANFLRLSNSYWNTTGDSSFIKDPIWMSAVQKVINTIQNQQEPTFDSKGKTCLIL